jgi:hypothetical protein
MRLLPKANQLPRMKLPDEAGTEGRRCAAWMACARRKAGMMDWHFRRDLAVSADGLTPLAKIVQMKR